ncbi:MAG: membrane or secreted protein [Chitinophagaceae bacterium]|nr:membrane or secreted protein [Chitinophagaceae bacterium]
MKSLQKLIMLIALITFFASCQSGTDVNQTLLKTDTRMEMMNKIADDSSMSKEMMTAMMNSKNGKMMMMEDGKMPMMMENHEAMMKMMKDNPGMMHTMMMNMMEACKSDTSMMSGMCKKMMENPQMMDMMQKMKGEKMDMKTGDMDNKMKH